MTKTRIWLGMFGIALAIAAVVFLAAGLMTEFGTARAQAAPNGKGHFRIEIDSNGKVSCFRRESKEPCNVKPPPAVPYEVVSVIQVIKTPTKNSCYINVDGTIYEVDCEP